MDSVVGLLALMQVQVGSGVIEGHYPIKDALGTRWKGERVQGLLVLLAADFISHLESSRSEQNHCLPQCKTEGEQQSSGASCPTGC